MASPQASPLYDDSSSSSSSSSEDEEQEKAPPRRPLAPVMRTSRRQVARRTRKLQEESDEDSSSDEDEPIRALVRRKAKKKAESSDDDDDEIKPARRKSGRQRKPTAKVKAESEESSDDDDEIIAVVRKSGRQRKPTAKVKAESSEEEETSEEEEEAKKTVPVGREVARPKKEDSDEEDSTDTDDDKEENSPPKHQQPAASEEESQTEDEKKPPRLPLVSSARASRKRKISYKESDTETEEDEETVVKQDDNRNKASSPVTTPATKRKKVNSPSAQERTCPHCQKVLATVRNLKLHIAKFTCRRDQMPAEIKEQQPVFSSIIKKEESSSDEEEEAKTPSIKKEDSSDDEEEENTPSRRQSARGRRAKKQFTEGEYSSSAGEEEDDGSEDSDFQQVASKKRNRSPKKDSEFACPHCKKEFAIRQGLEYHIANEVCKTDKPKKRAAKGEGKNSKLRGRGPKEERTCPHCNRVFSSILGKDYHVANRVCRQGRFNKSKQQPFALLDPGQEFVTKFGVVRVVQDSRAVPTAVLTQENERRLKLWKGAQGRLEKKRRDQYSKVAVHSLARRKRLNALFDPSTPNSDLARQTWKAYFGSTNLNDPGEGCGHWNFPRVAPAVPAGPHPMEPEDAYCERIVECVLIQDRRRLYECFTIDNPDNNTLEFVQREKLFPEVPNNTAVCMKINIRRNDLSQEYNENGLRFQCGDCGRIFVSIVGCKYHVTAKACHNKMGRRGENAETPEQIRAGLDRRAEILTEAQDQLLLEERNPKLFNQGPRLIPSSRPNDDSGEDSDEENDTKRRAMEIDRFKSQIVEEPRNNGRFTKKQRKWLPKKKRQMAYYPQVWRSLGFKVVPKAPRAAPVSFFKKKKKGEFVFPNAHMTEKVKGADDLKNTMKSLQEELIKIQSEQLGAYYPSVWKVLRFRKPSTRLFTVGGRRRRRPKRRRSAEGADEDPTDNEYEGETESEDDGLGHVGKKRTRSPPPFVPRPPPFAYAPPVIIDISVLAGEIDMGRYPSIKRNVIPTGEAEDYAAKHDDRCYMCKDSRGLLYLCDFCSKVNHLECLRTRFVIKDPEPHDDFMCNKCIQCILQRRRRAEKRRMRKSFGDDAVGDTVKRGPYGEIAMDGESKSEADPEKEVERDEYDELAAQGKHVEEILELLRDSQARLQQLVETSKINDFRRSLFE